MIAEIRLRTDTHGADFIESSLTVSGRTPETAHGESKMRKGTLVLPALAIATLASTSWGQLLSGTAGEISFQARLTDDKGEPVADGPHVLDFFFYTGPGAILPIGNVLNVNVDTVNGIAAVRIGPIDPTIFNGSSRWVGITVDDDDDSPLGDLLTPRIPLGAVPHAFRVDHVGNRELTDNVELGDSGTAGSMIVHAGIGSEALAIEGDDRSFRLFDQAGADRVVFRGDDGSAFVGQMRIESEPGIDPLAVQRTGQTAPDLAITNQGNIIIGEEQGTSAKLTVNVEGEDAFRIRTDGGTRFMVAQDGQVGVGTSVPAAKLQINPISGEQPLIVRQFGTTTPALQVTDSGEVILGNEEGTSALLTINANSEDAFRVRTDGGTRFMVAQDGQVGVGTSTPAAKLQINPASGENPLIVRQFGTTTPALQVTDTGEVVVGDEQGISALFTVNANGEDAFRVRTDGGTRFMVAQDGQVGVGTSTPSARFQVNSSSGENPMEIRRFGTTTPALLVTDTGEVIVGDETGASAQLTVNAPAGDDPFRARVNGITQAIINSDGEMGIGTGAPSARLHVSGVENNGSNATLRVTSGTQHMLFDGNEIDSISGSMFLNNNSDQDIILVQSGGAVGIGTSNIPADSLLAIDGKVRCEEVEVELSQDWPDYVFADDYPLIPLDELEKRIVAQKHLPGIPPASEIEAGGVKLGSMQAMTVEKIEELTLYVIQLNNRLNTLESENAKLRAQLNSRSAQ